MKSIRTFTTTDQRDFAALSGDWNPMHVDEVAARRTLFGRPVVHGVHGMLWGLSQLPESLLSSHTLSSIEARFMQPIHPGDEIECVISKATPGSTALSLQVDGQEKTRVQAVFTLSSHLRRCDAPPFAPEPAEELDFAAASKTTGVVQLGCDPSLAARLLPQIAAADWLPILLATTRIVGMKCPGLHSLFSSLKINFTPPHEASDLHYRVEHADPRFSSIRAHIENSRISGTLNTFLRPAPARQPSIADLSALVTPHEFKNWRAWVIGGSRGLGEVAAKLIATGGGKVAISYHQGREDAERVAAETGTDAFPFDVLSDTPPTLPWIPTHLFYFATPHITIDRGAPFSQGKYHRFTECYVTAFERVLRPYELGNHPLHVLYPSSVFLDETPPFTAEYCAAKCAGEELCKHLNKRHAHLHITAPRLPRMNTDQTASLIAASTHDPATVLLPILRAMQ